jgi:enoyl-CoA hydratase/carnithine racemase
MNDADEVLFARSGALATITLNRPKALNALNLSMIEKIDPELAAWESDDAVAAVLIKGTGEKAFCAGGDVRAVWEAGRSGGDLTKRFFWEEYSLNRRIHMFPKPYVALLDGVTMGGGVGLSIHGSHRVATERLMFAMPETGIGLFPDVGGTCFAYDRLEDIFAALESDGSDFAADTLATLKKKSPMSMKVTLAQLRRGKGMDFDASMTMEYRLSQGCMRPGSDFYEGIRAVLVDKDHSPNWRHATPEEVSDEEVEGFFAPVERELLFD